MHANWFANPLFQSLRNSREHFRELLRTIPLAVLAIHVLSGAVISAAPPRYDHVVIVVEENRTPGQIIGDTANAPYITSLANGGVRLSSMFAIEHPSQPNYLQLFSGSNQGVLDDDLPPNFSTTPTSIYPFRTANLAAELIGAGFTFAGFSEQLESAGANDRADYDPHSATHPGVYYRRKHNPWANWVAKVSPALANQLGSAVNLAFTQFPTDYNHLPTVSFIVPNQLHDMHDGSRREGDDWLRDHLNPYALWARTNNSLLIVTWDEDDYNEDNQIPTVFFGAGLRDGATINGTWTLHNLLRTIEDMYGVTTHAGAAAQVRPIVGPFATDPAVRVATFRQGLGGYTNACDTQLWQETPDANAAAAQLITADIDTGAASGNQQGQVLARFGNVFGTGAGQIPSNAVIHSAKLILHTPANATGVDNDSNDTFRLHRMLADWSDAATWNSLSGGVGADGVEAVGTTSFSAVPDVDGGPTIFDVTGDLELFQAGTPNRGWVIRPSSTGTGDGWTIYSSENTSAPTLRPTLEVVYSVAVTTYPSWASARNLAAGNDNPEADPDEDGANNLTEFAYNLNPLVADVHPVASLGTNGLPSARHFTVGINDTLQVQYLRRKAASVTGLSYSLEFSTDLVNWSTNQSASVTSLNADWERVTARPPVNLPNPQWFARVLLTLDQSPDASPK